MFGIDEEYTQQCYDYFNQNAQLGILQEECAELIIACSKIKRSKEVDLSNLKEELAHVAISSSVVAKIYGITQEDIERELDKKAKKYNFKRSKDHGRRT